MEKKHCHNLITYHGHTYIVLGWREWVRLPELGGAFIKAKIDTGARTSALHAFAIKRFRQQGKDKVHFDVHPLQRNDKKVIRCTAELVDIRFVTDSGAHRELRYVIVTPMILGGLCLPIEITLTNRATMTHRMLLGRKALHHHFMIDPSRSLQTLKGIK